MRYHLQSFAIERGWVAYDPALPVGTETQHYDSLWMRPAGMKLTGRGRVIAIIDHPLYREHTGYANNLLDYERVDVTKPVTDYHGASVVSIAVGEIGIAKDAKVVYRAFAPWERDKYPFNLVHAFENLKAYVERGGAVDVISASFGCMDTVPGAKEARATIAWFEDRNIPVFSPINTWGFTCCGPQGIVDWIRKPALEAHRMESCLQKIALPITNRALACFCAEQEAMLGAKYFRETKMDGGISWAMPFLAGLFADAREAIPDITKEKFLALLHASDKRVDFPLDTLRVLDTQKLVENVLKERRRSSLSGALSPGS